MTTRKIAIAVIHGIGRTTEDFAVALTHALDARCRDTCGDDLCIESVYWSPVLQTRKPTTS